MAPLLGLYGFDKHRTRENGVAADGAPNGIDTATIAKGRLVKRATGVPTRTLAQLAINLVNEATDGWTVGGRVAMRSLP